MTVAFCMHPLDNVATLLIASGPGCVTVQGEQSAEICIRETVAAAHKVAIADIPAGAPVIKYGWPIGKATQPIKTGEWVHLHNLASQYDERSGTLDLHTGSPTDLTGAYV